MLIPKLFEAIRAGNVKSEYVLGDRIIGRRQVRLKLVAEVVDPGSNPLATHSQMRSVESPVSNDQGIGGSVANNKRVDKPSASRRGSRRKHPLSK